MKKIIQFANVIDGKDPNVENGRNENDTGVKMLAKLMTDDDAEIALLLTRSPMTVKEVSDKGGKSPEDVGSVLAKLAQKGVIFMVHKNDEPVYNLVPWAPGIIEFIMVNKETVDEELSHLFYEMGMEASGVAPIVPMGMGGMRAIPVEKAIEADPHRATYEEIVTYLDQSDLYSCADCACRTSKNIMGEGCEHTIEGMCIQIGPHAEYYIRTGRGRQITREEAIEILNKAEREGLVHQIFNSEGPNKSSFLCNCCGCSCGVLRISALFQCPDMSRSNYVAKVDKDKCVACGACVEHCNVNALALGESLCNTMSETVEQERPYDTEWGQDKWDHDYLVRKMVGESGTSPCKSECPAHISIQGYIKKASQGKYDEALKIIKRDNPFPAVCGRICPHTCESECTRNNIDEPLAIDDIKKFIADKDLNLKDHYRPVIYENRPENVAVIGAGPAGLSCAYYLAVEGYNVTVFEKQPVLGGMLTMGIPSFRLEKDVINAEIDVIRELGVEFKTGIEVGKDVTIPQLRAQGYKAFYVAIGSQLGRNLGIEGEHVPGVITGVDFLRDVNLSNVKLEGPVVVVGGGNVAIDVARAAIRCGASSVDMYCLESRQEMPALDEEIEDAMNEGIRINPSWGPKSIISEKGKVTAIEFKKCVSVFDENHCFNPKYDENETKTIKVSIVLKSIGQGIEWGGLLASSKMEVNPNNTLKVDPKSLQSGDPDVFAGGDVVTGPKFAINAIAAGKQGATSIHRYVQGKHLTLRREREYHSLDKKNLDIDGYDLMPRQKVAHVDPKESRNTFLDLRGTLTEEQIQKEMQRCLGCGVTVVDEYQCIGCGICTTKCEFEAIYLERINDVAPVELAEMGINIQKYAMERAARITAKK